MVSVVASLLVAGVKPGVPDSSGNFPLHLACLGEDDRATDGDYLGCVRALLAKGVKVTARDGNRHTVIHAAARGGGEGDSRGGFRGVEERGRKGFR